MGTTGLNWHDEHEDVDDDTVLAPPEDMLPPSGDGGAAARRVLNEHVCGMLGLQPTPGGTGWQMDVVQFYFILSLSGVGKNKR